MGLKLRDVSLQRLIFFNSLFCFWLSMSCFTVSENIVGVMNPHFWVLHLICCWKNYITLFWSVVFNVTWVFFLKSEKSNWAKRSTETDSCNLSSEIVLFFSEEEWVCENGSFQVTCEHNLNFSGSFDIFWLEIWKLFPFIETRVTDIISKFVDTSSIGFHISWWLITFSSFFTSNFTLSDIVIVICTSDLSKESKSTSTGLSCEF